MSSHIPNFFKSHRNKQQLQQQAAAQQAQQLAAQQQAQLEQQKQQQQQQQQQHKPVQPSGVYSQSVGSSTSTDRTVRPQSAVAAVSGLAGQHHDVLQQAGNKGITSTSSSQDSNGSSTSAPTGPHPYEKPNTSVPGSASAGSSVSSSVAGLPIQARTLSNILSGGGGPIGTGKMQMSQQVPQNTYGQQGQQYQHGLTETGATAAGQMTGMSGINQPQGHQQYQQQQQQQQQSSYESADTMNVSGLSLNSPQPLQSGAGLGQQVGQQRVGSADEERAREKLREAQEQAAQAQAALQYASQQARVATINAVATQAAFANVSGGSAVKAGGANAAALRKTAGRYALSDFAIERTLGTGSFGRVHLVRSKHNGRFYAVKVLGKEKVVRMKQVEHTNSEREMLVRVRHPFLVNLWGTFHDVNNLYMVMDFVAGGELFSLLRKSQRFPNSVAKFYAAEVALALDYLHSLDIIYRDLKPENLLLGADGHVKVTDFGFAKYVPDITWTLCGTPDYLAPEVVQSKGYNKSVDWYALGVLIFEMLAGYPPFFTEDGNPMKLYEKIIGGKVRYPSYFDTLSKELLKNLLTGDLTKRYGNLRGGSADIFSHGWFSEVDWDKLYRREIPAPYVPKIEGDGDASQFDRYQEADVSEYGKSGHGPHDHLFPDF